MKYKTNPPLLFVGIIVIAAITAIATIRSQNQPSLASTQQPQTALDESQWPIADYNAPEPSDPRARAFKET